MVVIRPIAWETELVLASRSFSFLMRLLRPTFLLRSTDEVHQLNDNTLFWSMFLLFKTSM